MNIFNDIAGLRQKIGEWRAAGLKIGFVPTMGSLHQGHISLLEPLAQECDRLVASIFVNPLQFNDVRDFESYPSQLAQDQQMLQQQVDLLFVPDISLMYPDGQQAMTLVKVPELTETLEGACRQGHFDGVATVVLKLFNLVQPDVAVFGEKDYQQLKVIQKLVSDLNLPIDIISAPTLREVSGLAMSSRNARLTQQQRQQAAQLYQVLGWAKVRILAGEPVRLVESDALQALQDAQFEVDYVSCRYEQDFRPAAEAPLKRRLLAAARLGGVRLIDNIPID